MIWSQWAVAQLMTAVLVSGDMRFGKQLLEVPGVEMSY